MLGGVVIPEESGLRGRRGKDGVTEAAKLMSSHRGGGKLGATHRLGGPQHQEGRRLQPEVWGGDRRTGYPDTSGRGHWTGE